MTDEVDHTVRQQSWPRDKFHPVYEGFADWLDAEAPGEQGEHQARKQRNQPKWSARRV